MSRACLPAPLALSSPSSLLNASTSWAKNPARLAFPAPGSKRRDYGVQTLRPHLHQRSHHCLRVRPRRVRKDVNGITGDADHPELVYRSDFRTTLFPKPVGRYGHLPVKSLRGVFDTPLNSVWDTVGPQIRDLVKARKIHWSSIDPARFFTHAPLGEGGKGSLGPVVIWVGVIPGSTSADTAHEVSQEILTLLRKNGVDDAVVEWREAVPQRLAGPPLMRHVNSFNSTHYIRRFLTPLHGVPLAAEGMEEEDSQGTLTLWFHENRDKDGNLSNKVYGVSNCHVLRKNTTRGLDEITEAIADHGIRADLWARDIVNLRAKETQDAEDVEEIKAMQRRLDDETRAIADLEALHGVVTTNWSHTKLHRNIGYVQYAAAISVDEGDTPYTSDWAAFLTAEAKVRDEFEGNVVDLGAYLSRIHLVERKQRYSGSKYDLPDLTRIFYSLGGRFPDGNTTDLTVGRYAGLVSFTRNEVGIESVELGIYNSGDKTVEVFSAKGDSGSLVWHIKNGKARIVGQLHSGHNKGGSTSNHVTYCTPGWYLLKQIQKRFKYADFYRTTWSA
ncbi:hypothetical protein BGW80DRAFT_1560210 [Lactifluus volemus]|nr:hypothetical protein BGW80DRAFT_1560210 [Lactifluus volemus]